MNLEVCSTVCTLFTALLDHPQLNIKTDHWNNTLHNCAGIKSTWLCWILLTKQPQEMSLMHTNQNISDNWTNILHVCRFTCPARQVYRISTHLCIQRDMSWTNGNVLISCLVLYLNLAVTFQDLVLRASLWPSWYSGSIVATDLHNWGSDRNLPI